VGLLDYMTILPWYARARKLAWRGPSRYQLTPSLQSLNSGKFIKISLASLAFESMAIILTARISPCMKLLLAFIWELGHLVCVETLKFISLSLIPTLISATRPLIVYQPALAGPYSIASATWH
jgi:hypothetical protein